MNRMFTISQSVGVSSFLFGVFCLAVPFFWGYNPTYDPVGKLSLDEIGVFAATAGAILWGTSMIARSVSVRRHKSD